jgi:hypothetical protein
VGLRCQPLQRSGWQIPAGIQFTVALPAITVRAAGEVRMLDEMFMLLTAEGKLPKTVVRAALAAALLCISIGVARADDYSDTIALFRAAGQSAVFFDRSYGYAVFPGIGKGGFWIGGAHGDGRVYALGTLIGHASMTQVSVGAQFGGEAYSEIIFFEDKRALDEFTSGNFEFGADAGVVAITAGASVSAATNGNSAAASGGEKDATTAGGFRHGMAVFTIAKGGLMLDAAVAGEKFSYRALGSS